MNIMFIKDSKAKDINLF